MRYVVVLVMLLAGGCHDGAGGSASERSTHGRCHAVTFATGGGWRTRSTTAGGLRIGEATTARFHEPALVFPGHTLRKLPPNGIVVYAADYGRESQLPRRRGLPYALAEFRHDQGWEGQPAPNVQNPSRGLADRAEAELASLRWGFC